MTDADAEIACLAVVRECLLNAAVLLLSSRLLYQKAPAFILSYRSRYM